MCWGFQPKTEEDGRKFPFDELDLFTVSLNFANDISSFQESYLSRRALYFTDGQVCFDAANSPGLKAVSTGCQSRIMTISMQLYYQ